MLDIIQAKPMPFHLFNSPLVPPVQWCFSTSPEQKDHTNSCSSHYTADDTHKLLIHFQTPHYLSSVWNEALLKFKKEITSRKNNIFQYQPQYQFWINLRWIIRRLEPETSIVRFKPLAIIMPSHASAKKKYTTQHHLQNLLIMTRRTLATLQFLTQQIETEKSSHS